MGGYIGSKVGSLVTTAANVSGDATIDGNLTVKGTTITVDSATAQTVDLGDNDKIRLGDGDDLQIYHDGSASYISDSGTGGLKIMGSDYVALQSATGENYLVGGANDATTIYHNNVAKLATSSDGVDVTGDLKVTSGTDAQITINDNVGEVGSGNLALQVSNSAGSALKPMGFRAEDIRFATGSSERMRIDSSGRLLVGTSSSTGNGGVLQVKRTSAGATAYFETNGGSTQNILDIVQAGSSGASQAVRFHNNGYGNIVGSIGFSTTTTSYYTSSDHRLKENVTDITDGITRVKQLDPKRFNFIADADTTVDGFLAHEAQTVVPEAVTGTHNEVDDDDNPVYQGIDQAKLVPLLTAALQEAIAKIETLETKVAALEGA